jgi:hypothetical protein
MAMPSRVAAVIAAAALTVTPTAAFAAKAHHHSTPRSTCEALRKKEGRKAFDARFGTGKRHTNAMARCEKLHKTSKKKKG